MKSSGFLGLLGPGALTMLALMSGTVFGLGIVTAVAGWFGRGVRAEAIAKGWASGLCRAMRTRLPTDWTVRRAVVSGAIGVAVGALTGWPVAAVLTTVAVLTLPGLLGPDRAAARRTERMEALALWTEMLRDTLSAAAGLEQAVLVTADIAPTALEPQLHRLSAALRSGTPLPAALGRFADDMDDPLADLTVTALVTAATRQARHLGPLLGELAESVREQVAMRQRIDAGRASVRTGIRVTVLVTLGMAIGLVVFNRPYLAPFDSVTGQAVLAAVGALFAASFAYLTVSGRIDEPVRLVWTTTSGAVQPTANASEGWGGRE